MREFLVKLADRVVAEGEAPFAEEEKIKREEMRYALLHLADAADQACYGTGRNLLLSFEESCLIREIEGRYFFHKSA